MIVYIALTLWMALLTYAMQPRYVYDRGLGRNVMRAQRQHAFLAIAPLIFLIGFRSAGADTLAYIHNFNQLPIGFENLWNTIVSREGEFGFKAFGILIKTIFPYHYQLYLFLISLISGVCVSRSLSKHSEYYGLGMVLFMLLGEFTWMINGIRQFLAASIAFSFIDWIVKKKYIRYFLLIALLSTIHKYILTYFHLTTQVPRTLPRISFVGA